MMKDGHVYHPIRLIPTLIVMLKSVRYARDRYPSHGEGVAASQSGPIDSDVEYPHNRPSNTEQKV
jgi:hypothetical protein